MGSTAVVGPLGIGGVRYITERLLEALKREGIAVDRVVIDGNLLGQAFSYIKKMRFLQQYQDIIFTGSIPPQMHIFINNRVKVALFIHGFIYNELSGAITQAPPRIKAGALYLLSQWNFSKLFNRIDLYICHSITTCEANKIRDEFILIPQFIFPEEMRRYMEKSKSVKNNDGKTIKVVTYASFGDSPRLLKEHSLLTLMKLVSKQVNKEIEFIIINPSATAKKEYIGNLVVKWMPYLPREQFLKLLADSDLYIERCIDEELRLGSIDSALMGTPIAKLTHGFYVDRQDYTNEVIWESSFNKLVNTISDYLNNVEYWKPFYVKRLREFLLNKRNWDHIKEPLIKFLK